MTVCARCGKENDPDARVCEYCGQALEPGVVPPPRLLAHIQGLIPPEPVISTRQPHVVAGPLPEAGAMAGAGKEEVGESEEPGAPIALGGAAVVAAAALASKPSGPEEEEVAEPEPEGLESQADRQKGDQEVEPEEGGAAAVGTDEPPAAEDEEVIESDEGVPVAAVVGAAAATAADEESSVSDSEFTAAAAEPAVPPPPEPAGVGQAPGPPRSGPTLLVLAALLIIAILLSEFLPSTTGKPAPRSPAVEMAYSYIEILPNRARVLLAWDYEPTTQGEMQLLAQPILLHLRRKRARIANVSLRPTGPAVAADAFARVDSQLPLRAQMGQPPLVEFGFIPGDAAALRSLALAPAKAADLPELSAQEFGMNVADPLDTFDLIIEFSAETAASHEWVEQIAARQDTPLIIAASGAVAPSLRPYEQSKQVAVLLSGYSDALVYEQLLAPEGPVSDQRAAQTLTHLLLIAVIVIALLRAVFAGKPWSDD